MIKKPKERVLIGVLILFCNLTMIGQTLNEPTIEYNPNTVNTIAENRVSSNAEPIDYIFCDDDGFIEFDISQLQQELLSQFGLEDDDSEAILISTRSGKIVKLNAPYDNNNYALICGQIQPNSMSDVAVDQEGTIYTTSFAVLKRVDADACTQEDLLSFPFGTDMNSLSFDTNGNLYYGFGSSTKVYRFDADDLTTPYVWHDFGYGKAGGDFVMLNGKMYISWIETNNSYHLYEVTVDSDINYVSHIDLGAIKNQTYGLASEFGKLYGVTPTELYRINLDDFSFSTMLANNGAEGDWWGAAGLHEALTYDVATYTNNSDAINSVNAISGLWTNTQLGGQTIYVRIDNITNGTYTIYPLTLTINVMPEITTPSNLYICSEEPTNTFTLTDIEEELLQNVTQEVEVTYYESSYDRNNLINPLDIQHVSFSSFKVIYVRIANVHNDCYAITTFVLIRNSLPQLEPMVDDPTERMLANCYINSSEQGYFKLDEIYQDVAIDPQPNDIIQYYATFEDAENDVFELDINYVSTIGVVEELFIKVTNEEGCYDITNFFIDGDCVLTSTDLSNLFFPAYFTPNGDGYHDFWNIKGISQLMKEESNISIFDRYGKLMVIFKPSQGMGWDGAFNSYKLPSDDYWYKMETFNGKEFTGHFSLKR